MVTISDFPMNLEDQILVRKNQILVRKNETLVRKKERESLTCHSEC